MGAESFREARASVLEVFHAATGPFKLSGTGDSVGDEGGFAPDLASDDVFSLEYILEVKLVSNEPGRDFVAGNGRGFQRGKGRKRRAYSPLGKMRSLLRKNWSLIGSLCERYPTTH